MQAIDSLWKSSPVQQAYQRRNEFQLGDSANYFLSAVSKYTAEKYVPSDQDVLRARVKTNTIAKVNLFLLFYLRDYLMMPVVFCLFLIQLELLRDVCMFFDHF